jgi:hypothetical protein
MSKRLYLRCLLGVALVALALLLTDRLLWQPGLTEPAGHPLSLSPNLQLLKTHCQPILHGVQDHDADTDL